MSLKPAVTVGRPSLVLAAAALSLHPAVTTSPRITSAEQNPLHFDQPTGKPVQAVPTAQAASLHFGPQTAPNLVTEMTLALRGDPGKTAGLSQDAGQLARLGSDEGIYVSEDDVRALAAAQDTALITDYDALVAATLGV